MYKRIEVSNLKEIQQELIDYNFYIQTPDAIGDMSPLVETSVSSAEFFKIPELPKLKEFLNSILNIDYVTQFHIINLPGHTGSDIHIDSDESKWALNIPIKNCEDSSTTFYDNDKQTELCKITIDVPHFLNVGEHYHQVLNHSDNLRLMMTIRFNGKDLNEIIK